MSLIRAFFAIPLSVPAEHQLAANVKLLRPRLNRCLSSNSRIRWISASNYHLTLAFLGNIQNRDIERLHILARSVIDQELQERKLMPSQFAVESLTFSSLQWLPSALKPRLLAAVAEPNKRLLRFRKLLCQQLGQEGFHIEKREYKPHITLARVKHLESPVDLSEYLTPTHCEMDELVLFSSQLNPSGFIFQPLFTELIDR